VHNVHFAPHASAIILGGYDKRATVWEVPSGKQLLELSPTTDEMSDATFSPDGSQIATTGPDNDVQIWDASSAKLLQQVASHEAYVSHVLWLDQDTIVSNDWNGVITWMKRGLSGDFAVSTSWTTLGGLGIAISPDGTMLAAGTAQGDPAGLDDVA